MQPTCKDKASVRPKRDMAWHAMLCFALLCFAALLLCFACSVMPVTPCDAAFGACNQQPAQPEMPLPQLRLSKQSGRASISKHNRKAGATSHRGISSPSDTLCGTATPLFLCDTKPSPACLWRAL
ncbi:hypothetical protein V8C35DRAFT_106973 [Trichoderma chlorosporum]